MDHDGNDDLAGRVARLARATGHLPAPLAALDLEALRLGADDLVRRASGLPVRVASKSVRCRWVLETVLRRPGFAGVLAYSLREALWLAREGVEDVIVGYPTGDAAAVAELATSEAFERVTLMVDGEEQLDLIRAASGGAPLRLCLDVDASLRVGPLHLGVRRSPVRTPAQAAALAGAAARRGLRVVGVLLYEAQIAGLPDSSPAVRLVKRVSARELARRRSAVVEAVTGVAGPLAFVNGGGTGSLEVTSADAAVTEVTAGSGLYAPALFDHYRAFAPRPALLFALPVVRRPAPGMVTLGGGGWIASGPSGRSRLPVPAGPGLRLLRAEGMGEVQTPVRGPAAGGLRVGDRVWWRHAKAGELCEHVNDLHVVEGDDLITSVPTYRGEGRAFG
jgi:D-serine deaminase-like pyridoxal phosphate-dependent protein